MSKELNKALDLLREIRPSIPKDVLELWCKDRDAFLASHKETVEQAGGDERAVDGKPRATKCPDCGEGDLMPGDLCACGYETDPAAGYACSECDGSGDGYVGEVCRECDGSGWFVTPEQARAALAQPSPKCATCNGSGFVDDGEINFYPDGTPFENGSVKCVKDCPACKAQPSPEQAERPEVVGYCNPGHIERLKQMEITGFLVHEEESASISERLMTVAQHERIVGALRAELETERMRLVGCGVAALGYFDGCADAYKSASLSDVLRFRADCDAALARVAELERPLDATHYYPKAPANRQYRREIDGVWHEFCGGQWLPLDLAIPEQYVPLYTAAKAPHSVPEGWIDQLEQVLCDLKLGQSPAIALACSRIEGLLAAAPSPGKSAQHSVPEGFREKFEQCMELAFAEIAQYVSPEKARDPQSRARRASALATELRAMLAAAPGKEGV